MCLTSKHYIFGAPCQHFAETQTPRTDIIFSLFPNQSSNILKSFAKINGPQQRGALTEPTHPTRYDPNRIVEDRDYRLFTRDGQFTEFEDLRVRPLSFNQSIIASACDSAESIATPPESDFDDEQHCALLASPLYLQERGANAERSQVKLSVRENLMSGSSQDPTSTGKCVALFASQNRLNQETCSDREDFLFRHQQVFGSNEPFFRFSSSNKLMFSDWNWRTPILDMLISKGARSTTRRIGHERESIPRHSDWKYSRNGRFEESVRIMIRRILCTKIERKSCHDAETHFTNTRVASEGELHERFRSISRYRFELQ